MESVLSQKEQDWELIVLDDCSTDNTVAEIQKFNDPRIKLIQNEFNAGIDFSINRAFSNSKGEFIAFSASDDMLCSDYLAEASSILEENPQANVSYCNLAFIDENNNETGGSTSVKNQPRFSALNKMFLQGNQFSSPGMVIRREAMEKIVPLSLSLTQFQDCCMHVKLLLLGKVFVTDQRLVMYRRHSGNLSVNTEAVRLREYIETIDLMDLYCSIKDVDLIKKIFSEELQQLQLEVFPDTTEYCLGRIALLSRHFERQIWGYRKIMQLIDNVEYYRMLHRKYDFDFKTYLSLSQQFESYYSAIEQKREMAEQYRLMDEKRKKYRKLFNLLLAVVIFFSALIAYCVFSGHLMFFG
jgi:glycosyltransferase involved in cell wall biosynthesis